VGDTTSLVPGFPIRTSSDPRSVDNSPRHIAASHVLHRLPVPRHPPCALKHLQHKTKSYISNFEIAHQHTTRPETRRPPATLRARCSQPLSTNQTPHPTTKDEATTSPISGFPHSGRRDSGLVVSKPNSVSGSSITANFDYSKPVAAQRLSCTRTTPTTGVAHPSNRPNLGDPRDAGRLGSRGAP
jgi:hypothetical protein